MGDETDRIGLDGRGADGRETHRKGTVFVYLFKNTLTGRFKIGHSSQLHQRKTTLKNMGGALLEVWGILAFPTKREAQKHEFHLHKLYAPQRKVGEYFELGDTLANELAESMDRPPAPKPETKTLRPEVCLTKSEDIKSTPTISRSLALLAPKIPPTVSKTVFRQI